jgi:hypothetical protein
VSGHTPGPWEVCSDGAGWYIEAMPEREHSLAHISSPEWQESPDTSIDEAEANARLIASAPELLEACKMIVEYDEDVEESGGEFLRLYIKALNAARAAIAKATGEPA